jgi:hypothetical protein
MASGENSESCRPVSFCTRSMLRLPLNVPKSLSHRMTVQP